MTTADGAKPRPRWWREPLVHFLVIGVLMFAAFQWRGSAGPGSARIVVTTGQVEALASAFARTWQRPPTEDELKGQIDEYVREEIATREAATMGLDRDDTIIRRRLRQKFEFMLEDAIDAVSPTDAELQAWLETHPESFRTEPEVAFRQVHLSPDRRGRAIEADARTLRDRLSRSPRDVAIDALGDSVMLPRDVPRSTRRDIARQFGEAFADAILEVETDQWVAPVRSSFGVHVVFVRERAEGHQPALADVRAQVERDFTADRRRRRLAEMYEGLVARYRVVIEKREEAAK